MSNVTRKIVTISLPPQMVRAVKADAKEEGYASVSEYVRDLVREKQRTKLAKDFTKMDANWKNGRKGWKLLKSLKDLD